MLNRRRPDLQQVAMAVCQSAIRDARDTPTTPPGRARAAMILTCAASPEDPSGAHADPPVLLAGILSRVYDRSARGPDAGEWLNTALAREGWTVPQIAEETLWQLRADRSRWLPGFEAVLIRLARSGADRRVS